MSLKLSGITSANFKEACFIPTLKRETVVFSEKSDRDIYHANALTDEALSELKKRKPDQAEIDRYSDRRSLIRDTKEGIESHLERRIELFFQQAILCYKTPFVYETGGAEDQIGRGADIKLGPRGMHKSRAAHSSTLPCLYAYPKKADGTTDPTESFVFLKHSHVYNQHNATIELPIEVNDADCLLDGTSVQPGLRTPALALLNRLAQGKIDPTTATMRFLKEMKVRLKEGIAHHQDLRKSVFEIYLNHLRSVKAELKENPQFFDRIMGLDLKQAEAEESLRDVVYRKRFIVIQESALLESQIAKRLAGAQQIMFGTQSRQLSKLNSNLRYTLLKTATNGLERKFLEKIFCTSSKQLKSNLKKGAKERLVKAFAKIQKDHATELALLHRDLRKLRRNLEELETTYRSQLFQGLRGKYKGLYQWEFANLFKKRYPHEPMSQAMVSRLEQPARLITRLDYSSPIEQRRKEMDIPKAEKIAKTLGIDVGLFLPGLVSSTY